MGVEHPNTSLDATAVEATNPNSVDSDTPKFEIGATVVDKDASDEPSTARVLDPDAGRADQVTLAHSETTISDVNEHYPADDRVVEIVFDSDLQALPDSWSGPIDERVARFADEWGVSIRTYSYPESRLLEVGAGQTEL